MQAVHPYPRDKIRARFKGLLLCLVVVVLLLTVHKSFGGISLIFKIPRPHRYILSFYSPKLSNQTVNNVFVVSLLFLFFNPSLTLFYWFGLIQSSYLIYMLGRVSSRQSGRTS